MTALVGLVLVVAALSLAMAPVFPLEKFIAPGIADFEARTGTVVESGTTRIELFPTPSVIASDVTITLPDGLGEVKAERLTLAVSPLPFLSGVSRLSGVTLDKPVAHIALRSGDLAPLAAVTALTDLARMATGLRLTASEGRLDLDAGQQALALDHLGASAVHSGDGDQLVLTGETAGTNLTLTTIAGPDGAAELRLATPAGELALSGQFDAGKLDGKLTASAADLARLGDPLSSASGAVRIEGALHLSPQRAELVDAVATLFGGTGKLSAALDTSGKRSSLDIHADLPRLPASLLGALATSAAERDPFAEPAPLDVGLDLKATELVFPGGTARQIHLTAVNRGASFGVVLDRLAIGNGSLDARADFVPNGVERRLSTALTLDNLAIRDVATLMGVTSPLTGRLAGTLRLSAHGRSMAELAATLAVDGAATLEEGRLASLALSHALKTPPLTALAADLSIIGLDKPARLTATGTSASGPVTLEAETLPRRMFDGDGATTTIRLTDPALTATLDGEGNPAARTLRGNLTLTTDNLGNLLKGTPATKVSLGATLDAGPDRVDLSAVKLLIGDSAFAGLIGLATGGERDRLTGRLSGDVVDVAALAGALRDTGMKQLSGVDADLRIDAGRIVAGPLAAAGGPVDLRLYRNGAEIGLPNLSLGGGTGSARLTIAGQDRSALALKGKLDKTRLASLAPLVGSAIDGQLALDLDLQGQGATLNDLAASTSGKASISVTDGRLAGIDPMALLARLAKAVQPGFGDGNAPVAFDRLDGKLAIDKGVARIDGAAFSAGELSVKGDGRLTLADGSLDMTLKPAIKGYPAFEAPVALTGKPGNLRLYPKIDGLPDKPDEAYTKLHAGSGAFARLAGGAAPPKLKAASPDAMASMIDAATVKPAEAPKAAEAAKPATAGMVIPPLPLPKPAIPARAKPAQQVAAPTSGPLDLGSLGGAAATPKPARGGCNPGRDGRCLP
jgi:uncharacterized protein involved in outer membrane biogenesis